MVNCHREGEGQGAGWIPSEYCNLPSKNKPLLIRWNALLVLNLCFHIINCIRAFHLQGNGFSSESFDKYLHTTTKAQHQMQSRFLLDIIIGKGTTIFQLLPSKDKPLLIWWDTFFVLDLGLHIINCVRGFYLKGNGLPSQGLHKYLHATSQTKHKHQMKSGFLLNVVIGKGSSILKLFPGKDKPLLIWWNTLLVLNLGFHGYGFTSQGLDKDLHATSQTKHKVESGFLLDIVIPL
ncbi:hypothetical protein CR513_61092, partial [Mucuna pruriens]